VSYPAPKGGQAPREKGGKHAHPHFICRTIGSKRRVFGPDNLPIECEMRLFRENAPEWWDLCRFPWWCQSSTYTTAVISVGCIACPTKSWPVFFVLRYKERREAKTHTISYPTSTDTPPHWFHERVINYWIHQTISACINEPCSFHSWQQC